MLRAVAWGVLAIGIGWGCVAAGAESDTAGTVKTERVAFLGNSITLHAPSEAIGWSGNWGMAASALEKDYVHLVLQALARGQGERKSIVRNIADFERGFSTYRADVELRDVLDFKPDLLILAIGENVAELTSDEMKMQFREAVVNLLKLFQKEGQPTIVVRSCFWPSSAKDEALKSATTAVGGRFVDIGRLAADESNFARSERSIAHAGVAGHPGDKGMQGIADAILDAIVKTEKR